jgi:hypothetical protein
MPITARRPKAEAYEKGIREGTAMAKRSRGSKPTEEEEMDMGMVPGHSRKRRKPAADGYGMKKPMDGGMYGKKPMDAECGCGKKKGRKCDGDCGYKRKRSDSLTPQEYLTACELGIQDCSATYIRARLDEAERLDLKCGNGAISEGEKCTKGPATKVRPKTPNAISRYRGAKRTLERRYGKPKQKTKTTEQKLKAAAVVGLAVGAGVGAAALAGSQRSKRRLNRVPDISNVKVPKPGKLNTPGSASELQKSADRGRMNELESLARGKNPALEARLGAADMRNSKARRELEAMRGQFQRLRSELGVWGPNRIKPFKRKPKSDSTYADGFDIDWDSIAL